MRSKNGVSRERENRYLFGKGWGREDMGFGPMFSPLTILMMICSNFHFAPYVDPNSTNFSNIYFGEFG
jgi:hypothetical protein